MELAKLIPSSAEELHHQLALLMVVSGAATFLTLMFGPTAPYGRYTRGGWGPLINSNIAWMTQEIPSLLVAAAMCYRSGLVTYMDNPTSLRTVLTALFLSHYFYRSLVYPFLIKGRNRMPLSIWLMSVVYCAWNGYLQGFFLAYQLAPNSKISPLAAVGIAIQIVGWFNVMQADRILTSLRKPGEAGYKIPQGGPFRLVSAGNYASEILEWCGYALAARALPAAAFAFFAFCNLAPRAWRHHKWYLSKFEDYPKARRAVIPFVW